MVGHLALNQKIGVRLPVPQLRRCIKLINLLAMPFIDDSYISSKLKVKKISKTEKGVFAVKLIRKGEILAITGGLVIPYHRVVRLPKDIKSIAII